MCKISQKFSHKTVFCVHNPVLYPIFHVFLHLSINMSIQSIGDYLLLTSPPIPSFTPIPCLHPSYTSSLHCLKLPLSSLSPTHQAQIYSLVAVMSEYIQKIMDIRHSSQNLYVINEKGGDWTVRERRGRGDMENWEVRTVLREGLMGIRDLKGMWHGGITPDRIYLNEVTGGVKLADFPVIYGVKNDFESEYFQGPEVIRGSEPSPASDIYSLGCVAAYLETGRAPFSPKHCDFRDSSLQDLVGLMTRDRTEDRPSAVELLTHRFLAAE